MSISLKSTQHAAGTPTSVTPAFKGQLYINETTGDVYKAYGTSSGNWYLIVEENNISSVVNGKTAKTSMVDADKMAIIDTEASNVLKTLSWAYVKSILKTYFDTIYHKIYGYDVRAYGALCDGSTDDTTAVQDAITAATSTGGIVKFPAGICMVTNITLASGVVLQGIGQDYDKGSVIKKHASSNTSLPMIDVSGADTDHRIQNAGVRDMLLHGSDMAGDIIRCFYARKEIFDNIYIIGTTGRALFGVEFQDTYLKNMRFEYCGDATHPVVFLQNRTRSTAGFGYSEDCCCNIHFINSVWESNSYKHIELDGTSFSAPTDINLIYINGCKMETGTFNLPFIETTLGGVSGCTIKNLYLYAEGTPATPQDFIVWGGSITSMDGLNLGTGSADLVNSGVRYGVGGVWVNNVISNVQGNWGGNAPAEATVLIDADSQAVTLHNIRTTDGTDIKDNSGIAIKTRTSDVVATGMADGTYVGFAMVGVAGTALAFGDLVYLDPTDSRWELADANIAAGSDGDPRGILGICVLAAAADGDATRILLPGGVVRADAVFPTLTVNAPTYVSETAGDITHTQPTTTDAVIRIVGFGYDANTLFFNPSNEYITHT